MDEDNLLYIFSQPQRTLSNLTYSRPEFWFHCKCNLILKFGSNLSPPRVRRSTSLLASFRIPIKRSLLGITMWLSKGVADPFLLTPYNLVNNSLLNRAPSEGLKMRKIIRRHLLINDWSMCSRCVPCFATIVWFEEIIIEFYSFSLLL